MSVRGRSNAYELDKFGVVIKKLGLVKDMQIYWGGSTMFVDENSVPEFKLEDEPYIVDVRSIGGKYIRYE